MIGISQFVASVISMWAVTRFGRKTLLLFGHIGSAVCLSILGFVLLHEKNEAIPWLVCAYAFVFNVSNATVINVYLVETCTDIALGTSLVVMQIVILLETSTALYVIEWIQPSGFFFMYAIFSAAGSLFVYFFVAETFHVPECEKKRLYTPGAKFGRLYTEEEQV